MTDTPLTLPLAVLACKTLADVYTPSGKAGTVTAIAANSREALVTVDADTNHWHYIEVLTPSAELLRLARVNARTERVTVTLTLTPYEMHVLRGVLAADKYRAYRDGLQDTPWPTAVRVIATQVEGL